MSAPVTHQNWSLALRLLDNQWRDPALANQP